MRPLRQARKALLALRHWRPSGCRMGLGAECCAMRPTGQPCAAIWLDRATLGRPSARSLAEGLASFSRLARKRDATSPSSKRVSIRRLSQRNNAGSTERRREEVEAEARHLEEEAHFHRHHSLSMLLRGGCSVLVANLARRLGPAETWAQARGERQAIRAAASVGRRSCVLNCELANVERRAGCSRAQPLALAAMRRTRALARSFPIQSNSRDPWQVLHRAQQPCGAGS